MLTQLVMTARIWIGPTPLALLLARLSIKIRWELRHVMLRYRLG